MTDPSAADSDSLYRCEADGRLSVPESVHHLRDLPEMEPEAVLAAFRTSQQADFLALLGDLEQPGTPLSGLVEELRTQAESGNPFLSTALFEEKGLEAMFLDLHDHVMGHPVWRHPFFLRFFRGPLTRQQVRHFAVHYFNQVKNTRQCVALAAGRFHGLMEMPYRGLNERISELTQIVLAQLLADEYGVGTHAVDDYPGLGELLRAHTHVAMYRQMFEGLDVPFAEQDVPMLPAVADNVLTQRMLAGDPAFSPLEGLASVGLGMEWGVPEFFSLLLGGLVRHAAQTGAPLTAHHLEVLIAHVKYDVLHAVAVMLVTALHMRSLADLERVKQAVNALMAARYGMMDGLYREVFGEAAPGLAGADLESRYRLRERRYGRALDAARRTVAGERLAGGLRALRERPLPFVFDVPAEG